MYPFFLAAVLCVVAEGAILNFKRGSNASEPPSRIVGGEPAAAGEIPYQLSFRKYGRLFCGASIIKKFHALTAAHCCVAYTLVDLEVASGSLDRDGGQPHPVTGVFVHPKYDRVLTDYDSCVLRVINPFVWDSNTGPVLLTPSGVEPLNWDPVVVSGWGTVSRGGAESKVLLKTTIEIIPHEVCNLVYMLRITSRMLCAGQIGGGKDSCQGDSGGPLHSVPTGRQVGIVSWGYGCAELIFPGVYTNIAHPEISSFITSAMLL